MMRHSSGAEKWYSLHPVVSSESVPRMGFTFHRPTGWSMLNMCPAAIEINGASWIE